MKRYLFIVTTALVVVLGTQCGWAQDDCPPDCPPPQIVLDQCWLLCHLPSDPWGPWELVTIQGFAIAPNNLASSPAFQLTPAYRLASLSRATLFLEAPLVIGSPATVTYSDAVSRTYRSFFFTPSLRVKFGFAKLCCWWISGGGGPTMGVPAEFRNQLAADPGIGRTITGAFQFGVGADINPFKSRIGLRFEVRDFYSKVPNIVAGSGMKNTIIPGGGVTFRF